jgi:hypothetical protein
MDVTSPSVRRTLPPAVAALAQRCGAKADGDGDGDGDGDHVVLTQTGSMRADPAHRWAPFRARQTIAFDRIAFAWRAATGPFGCIIVTDALEATGPKLTVIALGLIPLARVPADEVLCKGELLRYLAELPLAPDAILRNAALSWEVVGPSSLRVSATHGGVRAYVDFSLGADGLVATAFAPDRPRLEGRTTVERPWTGRFTDYRTHEGRQLPFMAEVAWTVDGREAPCWRGAMQSWTPGVTK